ncbi:MAG: acetyl/propionyl/methylcrotonyl-CoA carboxylase subunit alpha [Magnetococcales bacterium]|nr:acetyl/propionyl/methylcrotonyl-CoA carboxylase subunit alpha [Magnetococcales bacterium]MBF0149773.1 acetyl/propionyl/methylcrotonyl-CoA carboxylase subunit alpha [Magnetococcales bacterium]MBF0173099.1 acetyl/propionyl/methylcrotonyl-CoA carboxylase subunit alpha [Magnetococcales bacterium]MBF0347040.1 acetyl/propionyl/methylcrotonyl-CoA carboxylase subunit alpha [Magnetococcales bacterium]MBF0630180.1 acetyl/propionyl/methylcrotonyl-CoA carboxylase subunit alpha [Magnetococcales bacterium
MKKILIANRGEIASRIIRTARRMDIRTVAVYSEADKENLFVRQADESYLLGPAPSTQSYLNVERILEVIDRSQADAVHPGYGFLSENAEFCRGLEERGVTFIGPAYGSIQSLGDKIQSKRIAIQAGVRTIPGFDGVIESADHALTVAKELGYPVMVKAAAGGGGKGMRIASNEVELLEAWTTCRNEGRSFFSDDRLLIEKFIDKPHHVEIQVLGDKHGTVLWLNDRDCSIQRRNQKVIEEAPSTFVDPNMRRAMGAQAVILAQAVGYYSAGTVEFVVGEDKNFYFLEMNSRLQVEHAVTEMITGLDLVEQMIRVARGEPLGFSQKDVKIKGCAIECRVYAENPYRNFMPSTGRLVYYRPPQENSKVRVDSGVFEGGEVSMHYDPMIAKLITWGHNREDALFQMEFALDEFLISGLDHNIDLLNSIIRHPRFIAGDYTTAFIQEVFPEGFTGARPSEEGTRAFAVAVAVIQSVESSLYRQIPALQDLVVMVEHEELHLTIEHKEGCDMVAFKSEDPVVVTHEYQAGSRLASLVIHHQPCTFRIRRLAEGFLMSHGGRTVTAIARSPRHHALSRHMLRKKPPDTSRLILSPMPGAVLKVLVGIGQTVNAGQTVCILEAMKMENTIRCEQDGKRVKAILVQAGDTVEVGQVIVEFE